MKNLFTLAFLCLCFFCSAQQISGFYSGTLYSDSTGMTQKYELAINEYRGKFYGYSYVTFVKKDTFYYGIRKINARREGDSLIVEDDKIILNNFPEPPAKRVGRVITIPLNGQDSIINLSGTWKTNQTKKYYSVPGVIKLDRSNDSASSPLIAHLKELKIIPTEYVANTSTETKVKVKEDKVKIKEERKKKEDDAVVKTEVKFKTEESGKPDEKIKIEEKTKPNGNTTIKKKTKSDEKTTTEQKNKNVEKIKIEEKTKPEVITKPAVPVITTLTYDQRKNKSLQTIETQSDSLILSFYDNGVVDGDSISVYLNGQPVITNSRLKSTATKKTILIDKVGEMNLLLVAENLGTLPPNTGLLMIKDGETVHQVNFSADLQTNAQIIIRRKQ
ncbi:MAG: hypothetical protein ACXWV9_06220 [Flavisolibacter sp.]